MKKSTVVLLSLFMFFFGAFIGFLISPIKGGIDSHNVSTNNNIFGKNDEDSLDETDDITALDGIE